MSSRLVARLTFSFEAFARRGGSDAPHADGWGIGFFDGADAQLLREPRPAAASACVRLLRQHPIESAIVVSHVRRATQGAIALANTQPFARELAGRMHLFAHNGHVPGVKADARFPLGRFVPIGDTDSEHAFCALLVRLERLWASSGMPSLEERRRELSSFARELAPLGPANFIYSDGDALFAHGHRRTQPGGAIEPPGLHVLCKSCVEPGAALQGVDVDAGDRDQRIVLFATVPLSDARWRPLEEGELLVARGGELVPR